MKLNVNMKSSEDPVAITGKFEVTANTAETVKELKERIAASQFIAFPSLKLSVKGKVLDDSMHLRDCNISEHDTLDFVLEASQQTIANQLADLLSARDLTVDELGLLYCYKYSVSVNQALKAIGCAMKLPEFIEQQKNLVLVDGKVSLKREQAAAPAPAPATTHTHKETIKPFDPTTEVKALLSDAPNSTLDIQQLCGKFFSKFGVTLQSVVGSAPRTWLETQKDFVYKNGRVMLAGVAASSTHTTPRQPKVTPQGAQPPPPPPGYEKGGEQKSLNAGAKEFVPGGKAADKAPAFNPKAKEFVPLAAQTHTHTSPPPGFPTPSSGTTTANVSPAGYSALPRGYVGGKTHGHAHTHTHYVDAELEKQCADILAESDNEEAREFTTGGVDLALMERPPGFEAPVHKAITLSSPEAMMQVQEFSASTTHTTPAAQSAAQAPRADQNYQDLHARVSSRSFNSRIAQTLTAVIEVVKAHCFLNVESILKSGAVGKGTAIVGSSEAELVFFVAGLPCEKPDHWLPPLLRAVCKVLDMHLVPSIACEVSTTPSSILIKTRQQVPVHIRFAPSVSSLGETYMAVAHAHPSVRKFLEPMFAKEQVQFVSKQSGAVKTTIRLLKWWREQQAWSNSVCVPGDYLLELITIYAYQQARPKDQTQAVATVMALLARFDELRIVWSNFYKRSDIWPPLMLHKPLLMDPVNPFLSVADPTEFDPREMMEKAATTHFFW